MPYSEFHSVLAVYVHVWDSAYAQRHRCPGLGHQYYRCGKCKQGLIEVFSVTDHDQQCSVCGHQVRVYKETGDGFREEG